MPIWVQLWGLDLKYWGERSLVKIVSKLGDFLKVDPATKNRDKLQFMRVMVEVNVSQSFLDTLQFLNEKGLLIVVDVTYEWKPEMCNKCKRMGHPTHNCKVTTTKKWVPKQKELVQISKEGMLVDNGTNEGKYVAPEKQTADSDVDKEGFSVAKRTARKSPGQLQAIPTKNGFAALLEDHDAPDTGIHIQVGKVSRESVAHTEEGGNPSLQYG